ncbi:phosphatidylinositol 4-phosphate 3-kinase C2 domain-containing subunit beta isoform X2 [Sinocyclocheilus grahami]|uniref:phosphatidylinositol 4-phosphate 3-kinase C2 domain-containing subunit beta isoform X2 n=1 Tax=Sinocyclocheilus grahami TaxID=75366 RepID=UPI0007AC7480|nr:PREDICTED: phosphatidylinositol 4-phosphate 3-kinase C2 domain-containing subunit beta isoform X2 [Sinocyclocheilus grahami]
MSAAQTQNDQEQRWGCLESLGLSQRELVLAEALQMEYDALARHRQDKGPANTLPPETSKSSPTRSEPSMPRRVPSPPWNNLQQGVSGSDPMLNHVQPGVSNLSRSSGESHGFSKEPRYILDEWESDLEGTAQLLSKGLPSLDEPPPPVPPRNPVSQNDPFIVHQSSAPRDVNLFTPEVDQPKLSFGDTLNYDNLNDSLSKLNGDWLSPNRSRRVNGDKSGKAVARSNTLPPQVPPRTYLPLQKSTRSQRRVSVDPVSLGSWSNGFGYELFQLSEERDEEVAAFCHILDLLRSAYPCNDYSKNAGFVWSPCVAQDELQQGLGVSIKVTVYSDHFREPLTFSCDGSSTIDLLIYQTLCYVHDDLDMIDVDDYLMKICGQAEFLKNNQTLVGFEYIQQCLKFDWDIQLILTKRSSVNMELARTTEDDDTPSTMNHSILLQERPIKQTVTREALTLLLDTFHNEAESFLLSEVELPLHVERLVQSVKALCTSLAAVETPDITAALNQLPACPCRLQPKVQKDVSVLAKRENRAAIVEKLTAAILDLVELYCSTFNANFHTMPHSSRSTAPIQEAGMVTNVLSFSVYAAHRIPITWAASYENFFLSCSLTHGGVELCAPQHTSKQSVSKYLFHLVVWDQRVCFPIQINQLPRESQLTVTLYATSLPPPGGAEEKSKQKRSIEALGWVTMPLFNFRHVLTCGRKLLGFWPSTPGSGNARSSTPNFSQPDSVILQVDFPTSSFEVRFSTPAPAEFSPQYEFSRLDQLSQRQLHDVLHKKSLFWLTPEDRRLLWEKRYFCHVEASRLPLVLASAPSWEWACLPDIYALLRQWGCMNHLDTLGLLNATFPDQECRRTAVQWMDSISDPELLDFLPQLVQALKYECYLDSHLVRFLLRRAIGDVRIAHYLFWLLKDTLQDSQFSVRYQYLLAALLCCSGRGLRDEFDGQCWLVNILAKVAQRVRDSSPSSRQAILREGLEEVKQFFSVNSTCRLPLNPGLLVKGINIQSCSYFNSNAVPLKLSFQNQDPLGDNINVIFKSGDDLRQDMLTLQIIRIMNKIWIQEGLDMRMVIFRCFSTGRGRGMVEMIPNAETLRKIQVEHGVTGSFKDRPLADWLQKHNPTEDEYEKAVENFIYSCAGCCVATYILGICDRHNDNIMLKSSGHMFHIDFGKFLGHAQMFGNIKRDRAPFVFTSDMAYVINGGDKPSSRFHDFVDLCCEAYNLIRKHAHLFLNLLGLCDLIYTFFHPLPRDERAGSVGTVVNALHNKPADVSWAPVPGTVAGEVKLSILYKSDKLFIMVMHIRGLQPLQDGTDPDPYVKLYLLPDPQKTSKRKTKAARRTCNPTYNEMLVYDKIPRGDLQQRTIHLRVLSEGAFWENTLLGETIIQLKDLTPGHRWVGWHQLGTRGSDINR